jgi:hypothetical protein
VLSPGNDGAVSQSNEASSSATAANTASTTQNAAQGLLTGCGCAATGLSSGKIDDVLAGAMQAAGTDAAAPATAAPSTGSSAQSNDASSAGTAANTAPTTQAASQSSAGTGGVQSSQQNATTDQTAQAASSATQIAPSNSNISVRVLSPGNDGAVSQSNEASSTAGATNSAGTTQGSTQTGAGSGVQSSTQSADTSQESLALSSATQVHPENSNLSVRVLSPGNGGSVSQSNEAESSANAQNTAPVLQTARQTELGTTCGCSSSSTSPAVQAIGQSSSVWQDAAAASSATQLGASNVSDPVRIASYGDDGSLTQSNEVSSDASAKNTAPVTQWGSQQQAASPCGCTTGPAVQALGQSSWIGQQAEALSSAWQIGATNESGPIRIASNGNGGPVSQSNEADSSASASNTALPYQVGSQVQGGSGVQALGQHSSIWQGALAASAAFQLPGTSTCGCGRSFGNSAGPIRIGSAGNDGALTQENEVSSSADASNWAAPTQIGTQTQFLPPCGCSGLRVQALGQESLIHQVAAALSSATQAGASNTSDPVRIWSLGGSGSTRQSNEAESLATAPNVARILQVGMQLLV